ncbi:tRNA lysidine(34) synthetase TilS [Spiribacter pallidus]|uniref:tRNA lysidine(34) synthetase TilS n=1 Tax=Spiribacter pallidus TaxID=1987936 RepID=UPI00349F23A8
MSHDVAGPSPALILNALPGDAHALAVGFSGGVDSSVLLDLAGQCGHPVRAIHIHHGLSPDADQWTDHCRSVCQRYGIDLQVVGVRPRQQGQGPEAAARQVRYQAFEAALAEGEALLLGHHADDQAETLLLRLVRGTGPDGMGGMARVRPLGKGWLVRPLLDQTRRDLKAYAHDQGLGWVDDPSNDQARFDRNYLRHHVLPTLTARWPQAVSAITRYASHRRDEAQATRPLVDRWLAEHALFNGPAGDEAPGAIGPLPVESLAAEPIPLQKVLLRRWLTVGGMAVPGSQQLAAGRAMLLEASADAQPQWAWPGGRVTRHRGYLFRLPAQWPAVPAPLRLRPGAAQAWGDIGRIVVGRRVAADEGLWVRPPRPGDRLPIRRGGHTPVKERLRRAGVPPWWRHRLPLLVDGSDKPLALIDGSATGEGPGDDGLFFAPARLPSGPDWHWLGPGRG